MPLKPTIHTNSYEAANVLINWYNRVRNNNENPFDFYCGITCHPLQRMKEHKVPEGTPNFWINTDSFETASAVEKIMNNNNFDCGEQLGNGTDDSTFVYIYRKTKETEE